MGLVLRVRGPFPRPIVTKARDALREADLFIYSGMATKLDGEARRIPGLKKDYVELSYHV